MLAMTLRPSPTTAGRESNAPLSRTSWATARDAELPEPMAMPMSESFRASTSLTPSPVMATTCPRFCRAATIFRFWCGLIRPNTVCDSRASANSCGSSGRLPPSIARSAPDMPARRAIADTVAGWSPEMTLACTP